MQKFITADEACEILKVSRKTLWVYVNEHRHRKALTTYRISHKKLLFCKQSVFNFIEKCKSI
ncbi:helix-turn-helix domain-containing protein [Alteromonadales bacterium alter-6D02]|uniref:helix-turn-helix domain-containing protein n=1 Tax=Psychrobium sp. 1_MG-2023 TaxID=3062624 RepID=UPI000C34F41F|nr:hypothetical protein CW748_13890 [Alteromonadales bacterium alter-6D02]